MSGKSTPLLEQILGAKSKVAVLRDLFSLVMTARANGVEPFAYLNEIFEQLPKAKTVQDFEALLPWNTEAILETGTVATG